MCSHNLICRLITLKVISIGTWKFMLIVDIIHKQQNWYLYNIHDRFRYHQKMLVLARYRYRYQNWCSPTYNQAEGTSFQSRVEFQVDNAQLVRSTGVKVSVMALQGRKSSRQKSRPLESGHRRHAVWIAIEYSYKLGQKMNLNFGANYIGWFLQRQSHICLYFTITVTSE